LRGPEGSHIEHVAAAWGVLADDEKDQEWVWSCWAHGWFSSPDSNPRESFDHSNQQLLSW
jgi:hypothetical protein